MSADARNVVTLIGGIVADPEIKGDGKLVQFRLALDYAGNDTVNPENKTGYFTIKYFNNDNNPNAKFVFNQVQEGKMAKGSQGIAVTGRLQHERWETDGNKRDAIVIVAENITYVGSKPAADKDDTATGTKDNVPGW